MAKLNTRPRTTTTMVVPDDIKIKANRLQQRMGLNTFSALTCFAISDIYHRTFSDELEINEE